MRVTSPLPRFVDQLDGETADHLASLGAVRSARPGEVVFLQGENGGRVGIVLDGVVALSTGDDHGRSALVGLRTAGDLLGEVEAVLGGARGMSGTAPRPASLRIVGLTAFRRLVTDTPSGRAALTTVLAAQAQLAVEWRLGAGRPVPLRLARCLLELCDEYGLPDVDGSIHIDLPLSQDDLAAFVGASRDAVAKTLAGWRRLGLVTTARRRFAVCDRARLRFVAAVR